MTTDYKRDFFEEAHIILKNQGYRNYIEKLLPAGKWKNGEYVVKNPTRDNKKARAFSINQGGVWKDFSSGDVGRDLIDLTAYIKGISKLEACFYIGVPRLEKSNTKITPQTDIKPTGGVNLNAEDEYSPIAQKVADKVLLELEQEAIEGEAIKPIKEGGSSPTKATLDTELIPKKPVPEFTEANIGVRTQARFKGGELSYYRYYSSKGIAVGCVVRCDMDIEGDKVKSFAQFSYDRIKEKWQGSWSGEGKPLYNLQEIVTRVDAPIMIVEGEKTAEAAKLLFPDYIITTSCMGSASPRSSNWSFLRNRDVIIAPDNDKTGAKYARNLNDILAKTEAKSIRGLDVKKLGRFTIVDGKPQQRDEPIPDKYDLADNAVDGWTAELIEEWKEHKDFEPFFEVIKDVQAIRELPKEGEEVLHIKGTNYRLSKKTNTLWWKRVKTDGRSGETVTTWIPLSGYIKPTHCMKDANGDHGLLTEIVTRRGEHVECFFAREETATEKDTTKILLQKGLPITNLKPDNCYALNFFLNNFEPENKAVGVDTVGWQGANNEAYMLPFTGEPRNNYANKKEGVKNVEYILQHKGSTARSLTKKGTLKEWKRTVGEVSRGNHLHTFAILTALTAPALKVLGEEGGFVHYVGNTSIGKSTILHVAKSVWGFDNLGSFRTTDNALESVCKNSNDGAMFLDEIGEIEPEAFFKIIYMLANGVTKGRSDRSGNAKSTTFFTVLAQSTGEIGLEAKLAEKRIQAKGGQLMRMAELDADRGKGLATFDVLNTNPDTGEVFQDGKAQAEYLKLHAKENCGVVIDEFMRQIVDNSIIGVEKYKKGLKVRKEQWLEKNLTGTEGVEVARMAKRFSIIFASGALAAFLQIIPHTVEEVQACVDAMFQNWIERRGGDTPHEFKSMVADLYKLCKQNQHLRFQPATYCKEDNIKFPNDKAGYWTTKKITDDNGNSITVLDEFWISLRVFDNEVLKGRDKKSFLPMLVKSGYLKQSTDKKNTITKNPKGEDRQRFYVIPASAFNGMQQEYNDVATEENEDKRNGIIQNGVFSHVKV